MQIYFADRRLARLASEVQYTGRIPPGVVKTYRKTIQLLRDAADERDLYARRALCYKRLKGQRRHQH